MDAVVSAFPSPTHLVYNLATNSYDTKMPVKTSEETEGTQGARERENQPYNANYRDVSEWQAGLALVPSLAYILGMQVLITRSCLRPCAPIFQLHKQGSRFSLYPSRQSYDNNRNYLRNLPHCVPYLSRSRFCFLRTRC